MINHHPTEETLAAFASGTLCEANSLVVATHLMLCDTCRKAVRDIDIVGGDLLENSVSSPISAAARTNCLARLDEDLTTSPLAVATPARPEISKLGNWATETLALYPSAEWKWLSPGIQIRVIDVPSNIGTRVFLLKAAAGKRLPDHSHIGTEWTCVLQGAFRHDGGRFGPGDFDEADSEFDHNPQVEHGVECICLVAMNGDIQMKSWIGRLIQPLVKF